MPRPPSVNPRSKQLGVALTQDEYAIVTERADAVGLRPVDYARAAMLGQMIVAAKAVTMSRYDKLTLEAWSRVGSNLNQVARQLNSLQRVEAAEVQLVLADVRKLIIEAQSHGA